MVISFSDPLARRQLLEKGRVVTFRKTLRKQFLKGSKSWDDAASGLDLWIKDWANTGRGTKKIADVKIRLIGMVKIHKLREVLSRYVSLSGFETVEEWIEAIRRLNYGTLYHGRLPRIGWLYEVALVRK